MAAEEAAALAATLLAEVDLGVQAAMGITQAIVPTEIEVRVRSATAEGDQWEAIVTSIPGQAEAALVSDGDGAPSSSPAASIARLSDVVAGWPVEAIQGIGGKTAAALRKIEIRAIKDLAAIHPRHLITTRRAAYVHRASQLLSWPSITKTDYDNEMSLLEVIADPRRDRTTWWTVVALADLLDDEWLGRLRVHDLGR